MTKSNSKFYYGYVIAIAGFFIMLILASRSVFGIFFGPIVEQLGWSTALMSGAFSLSIIMDGILGIFMGQLTNRFGEWKELIVCGLLAGAGYLLMARITAF